jgi:hypothetical protein
VDKTALEGLPERERKRQEVCRLMFYRGKLLNSRFVVNLRVYRY